MKRYLPYLNKVVQIIFDDHQLTPEDSENNPIPCTVYGEVVNVNKKAIKLRYWHCPGHADNNEYIVIIHSTIIRIERLHTSRKNKKVNRGKI